MIYGRANIPQGYNIHSFRFHVQAQQNNKTIDELYTNEISDVRHVVVQILSKAYKCVVLSYGDVVLSTREENMTIEEATRFVQLHLRRLR